MSGLYLLAAPSTPAKARDEIIVRAAGGEKVTTAQVKTGSGLPSRPDVVAARTGCLCPEMAAKFSAILECNHGLN